MLGMFEGELGTFVALGVRGSRMIDNCSFNLGEFYAKMEKNRKIYDPERPISLGLNTSHGGTDKSEELPKQQ